jgi:hypothetical protein
MVPGSHGESFEELIKPKIETTRKSKGRQENRSAKRRSQIFIENVTIRYILAIQDLPKKQHDRGRIS